MCCSVSPLPLDDEWDTEHLCQESSKATHKTAPLTALRDPSPSLNRLISAPRNIL